MRAVVFDPENCLLVSNSVDAKDSIQNVAANRIFTGLGMPDGLGNLRTSALLDL
jgi:hypothetical protein